MWVRLFADAIRTTHWWPPLNTWLTVCVEQVFKLFLKRRPWVSLSRSESPRKHNKLSKTYCGLSGAFTGHTKMRVPMDHLAILWLIEHTASILNRFVVGMIVMPQTNDCMAGGQIKKGNRVWREAFYDIPRKLRTDMNTRWRIGMYFRVAPQSGGHCVGT